MKVWKEALGAPWWNAVAARMSAAQVLAVQQMWEAAHASPPVLPEARNVFAAFQGVAPEGVRVVLLGQDPYHGIGQAHGLAFSVQRGQPHPPSLRNVLKELANDVPAPPSGTGVEAGEGVLSGWAEQGVLLLNAALTVEVGLAGAHRGKGWEAFTAAVIGALSEREQPLIFLLWGKQAEHWAPWVHRPEHRVFSSPHPSPLSAHRGFFGSRPFSRANAWLVAQGVEPVDWWRGIPRG